MDKNYVFNIILHVSVNYYPLLAPLCSFVCENTIN